MSSECPRRDDIVGVDSRYRETVDNRIITTLLLKCVLSSNAATSIAAMLMAGGTSQILSSVCNVWRYSCVSLRWKAVFSGIGEYPGPVFEYRTTAGMRCLKVKLRFELRYT